MSATSVEYSTTLWLVNDIPPRMMFAGRRWRVTDTPTRLRHSVWSAPLEPHMGLYGWRFQGTNEDGLSPVLDACKGEDGWRVHRNYD
ncbi:hypothetical protein HWD99_06095 [Microbacterium sp. C5A9]|uniref:hypothetical protein n=1 Tax=Microbacterium sp. C5A9 TaxID=2736663 RepID=UPI001F523E5A|nr:hypothetical protein [Microbacterium sp. C5A9]MCI1018190.1 hypothetical protein [Microbacterium sp. C5A9]